MCYNPLIIKNNRKDFYRALHQSTIEVPCGTCEDCVNLRRSDYATRTAFECKRFNVGNGGSAIMVLLTYNNSSVPYLPETDQMSFNREHIKLLNDMLRAYYFSDRHNPKFAYLIGAEYGVDERFSLRPHYHGLYILDKSIDPKDFMHTIRQIWQNQLESIYVASERHTYKWSFGNLGFVFPFENDTDHPYIVKDAGAASLYCAKYAVKQVGFYNKPALQYVLKHGLKHRYLKYFPKVWLSRGFGKSMINDATFDIEKQQVINPYTLRSVSIPRSIQDMYLYERVYKGERRPSYDPETHTQILNKNGTLRTHCVYDRQYKPFAYDIKLNQLERYLSDFQAKLCSLGCLSSVAYTLSVFHYVFHRLPVAVIANRFGFGVDDITPYVSHYKEIYTFVKLHRFNLKSEIEYKNFKPLYKYRGTELLYGTSIVAQAGGEVTFDSLLSPELLSLYHHYIPLLMNIQNENKHQRDTKYETSQKLRLLVHGEHPLC